MKASGLTGELNGRAARTVAGARANSTSTLGAMIHQVSPARAAAEQRFAGPVAKTGLNATIV